ncbi:MAG: hypothetical protein L6R38_006027 [Xanthoria sp. 2 TBL-2021]|nr:MAG: hypothetical protein L6R38_006027 [Xanthoria sp. 2 TBL-2021]
MSPWKEVFQSKHFSYTLEVPRLIDAYHCQTCERDFAESQRYYKNRDALQGLANLLQQQGTKVDKVEQDGDMKKLWEREMANLETKAGELVEEMKGIERDIECSSKKKKHRG